MMVEIISEHRCHGGIQAFYRHDSETIGLPMRFSIFHPPQEGSERVPAVFWLAGLTCTEETFPIKANAQRIAAQYGLMLIAPDTSPRNTGIEGENLDWDLGSGAGFYIDASQEPWSRYYRMESWITQELFDLVQNQFNVDPERVGIMGHSMGGHGALTLALRHPERFRSVSAFAPISAPSRCPWGEKAFTAYFGSNRDGWREHDASELMKQRQAPFPKGILIDQGLGDKFLHDQLLPQEFEKACTAANQPLTIRRHEGYDHGYYFISTFIDDHLKHHQQQLK